MKKNNIPLLSVANGFTFPDKNKILELNKLEERLVSPVNVFMQLRNLASGSPNAVRVNGHNPHILKAWKANCDLQFITSPYGCGIYVVGYISKG